MNSITIFNGTPHPISLISGATFAPEIRKFVGGQIVREIPASGTLLSATISVEESEAVDGIPVYVKNITGCDPLPEGYDVYIASALYASAYTGPMRDRLYTVSDPVMTDDGKTIRGCRGLQKA